MKKLLWRIGVVTFVMAWSLTVQPANGQLMVTPSPTMSPQPTVAVPAPQTIPTPQPVVPASAQQAVAGPPPPVFSSPVVMPVSGQSAFTPGVAVNVLSSMIAPSTPTATSTVTGTQAVSAPTMQSSVAAQAVAGQSATTPASAPLATTTIKPVIAQTGTPPRLSPNTQPALRRASNGGFYIKVAGGVDNPVENWLPAYTLGSGESAGVGFALDDDLAIQLDVDSFYFTGVTTTNAITDYELRIVPTLRLFLLPGDIRPYILAGTGLDVETVAALTGPSGVSTVTSWDVAAGLGVELKLENKLAFYLEGKMNLIIAEPDDTTQAAIDIPVLAGLRLGL